MVHGVKHSVARIVGTTTAGSVRIGDKFRLTSGYRLQAPIAEIAIPDGTVIEGQGVTPDRILSPEETARDEFIVPLVLSMANTSRLE